MSPIKNGGITLHSDMPCSRQRSAHFAPASCSARMPMICSSVNLVRFIVRPQVGPDSNRCWRKNPVAGHWRTKLGHHGVPDRNLQTEWDRATWLPLWRTDGHREWEQTSGHQRSVALELPLTRVIGAPLTPNRLQLSLLKPWSHKGPFISSSMMWPECSCSAIVLKIPSATE